VGSGQGSSALLHARVLTRVDAAPAAAAGAVPHTRLRSRALNTCGSRRRCRSPAAAVAAAMQPTMPHLTRPAAGAAAGYMRGTAGRPWATAAGRDGARATEHDLHDGRQTADVDAGLITIRFARVTIPFSSPDRPPRPDSALSVLAPWHTRVPGLDLGADANTKSGCRHEERASLFQYIPRSSASSL
jgi:hypothetical protein